MFVCVGVYHWWGLWGWAQFPRYIETYFAPERRPVELRRIFQPVSRSGPVSRAAPTDRGREKKLADTTAVRGVAAMFSPAHGAATETGEGLSEA